MGPKQERPSEATLPQCAINPKETHSLGGHPKAANEGHLKTGQRN